MAVTDEAIEKIKGMIVSGALRPGDRLPKESELAADLGLSRNSLREAVRALSLIRILDVRQGDGTYVTSLDPQLLLEALSFVVDFHRDDTVLEFLAVRRILEPAATAMAGPRITDAELDELSAQLDALGPAAVGGGTGRLRSGVPPRHRPVVGQLGALLAAGRALRADHPGPDLARADPAGRGQPHPARAPGDPRRAAGPGRGGRALLGDGAHRQRRAVAALHPLKPRGTPGRAARSGRRGVRVPERRAGRGARPLADQDAAPPGQSLSR